MPRLKSKSVATLPDLIGWRELVHLPELGLGPLIAKVDTGARSAALHAEDIHVQGHRVRFRVAISGRNHFCEAAVKGQRRVKSSSGGSEARLVIETFIAIGRHLMKGEITLTDRTDDGRADAARARPHPRPVHRASRAHLHHQHQKTKEKMKIALLTRNPKLYSHQRIMEAAKARGHEIVPIDYLRCYMNITSRKPELRYLGEKLTGFDAVIPRIAASHTFYGLAVLRQFEMMGVYPLNELVAIGRSRDKLR